MSIWQQIKVWDWKLIQTLVCRVSAGGKRADGCIGQWLLSRAAALTRSHYFGGFAAFPPPIRHSTEHAARFYVGEPGFFLGILSSGT